MKNLKSTSFILILTLLILSTNSTFAQNYIKGKVIDSETQDPIIGATILTDMDATISTTTNNEGYFEIKASANEQLHISFIGYNNETVYIKNAQEKIVVKLQPKSLTLSDVVVVGQYAVDRQTPIASSTIWASEISSKLGNQEFVEILKYTPGVHPNRQGGSWSDSQIYMRGFDNTNIAV